MVQHKRTHTATSRSYIFNYASKEMEMNKPVAWWQMLISVITFGIGLATIAVNTSTRITRLEEQSSVMQKNYDKLSSQLEKVSEQSTQILIILQNKQDRK